MNLNLIGGDGVALDGRINPLSNLQNNNEDSIDMGNLRFLANTLRSLPSKLYMLHHIIITVTFISLPSKFSSHSYHGRIRWSSFRALSLRMFQEEVSSSLVLYNKHSNRDFVGNLGRTSDGAVTLSSIVGCDC